MSYRDELKTLSDNQILRLNAERQKESLPMEVDQQEAPVPEPRGLGSLRSAILSSANPPLGQGAYGGPCRMTARTALEERVRKLRREADNLEALLKALPMELPRSADEALWEMTLRR